MEVHKLYAINKNLFLTSCGVSDDRYRGIFLDPNTPIDAKIGSFVTRFFCKFIPFLMDNFNVTSCKISKTKTGERNFCISNDSKIKMEITSNTTSSQFEISENKQNSNFRSIISLTTDAQSPSMALSYNFPKNPKRKEYEYHHVGASITIDTNGAIRDEIHLEKVPGQGKSICPLNDPDKLDLLMNELKAFEENILERSEDLKDSPETEPTKTAKGNGLSFTTLLAGLAMAGTTGMGVAYLNYKSKQQKSEKPSETLSHPVKTNPKT